MDNDSEIISANEINKYTYCPYQFYYERLYGRKKISAIRKEMLEDLGYTDTSKSNLKRGLDYHNDYNTMPEKKYPVFLLIVFVIIMVIGVSIYDKLFILISNFFTMFNIF